MVKISVSANFMYKFPNLITTSITNELVLRDGGQPPAQYL